MAERRSSHLAATLHRLTSYEETEGREEMACLNHTVAEGLCPLVQGAGDKITPCHIHSFEVKDVFE